jgi:hypothetical protein
MDATNFQSIQPSGVQLQQQTFVVRGSNIVDTYQHRQARLTGLTLIVVGFLAIAFNLVDIGIDAHHQEWGVRYVSGGFIGHGVWSGSVCIVAGCVGIAAGIKKTRCKIVAFMVMSIVVASTCLVQLIIGVIGAIEASRLFVRKCRSSDYSVVSYRYHYPSDYSSTTRPSLTTTCIEIRTQVAMESLLAILAVFGGVAAIWASAICCKAVCCCSQTFYSPNNMVPIFTQTQGDQVVRFAAAYPAPGQAPRGMLPGGVFPMSTAIPLSNYSHQVQQAGGSAVVAAVAEGVMSSSPPPTYSAANFQDNNTGMKR